MRAMYEEGRPGTRVPFVSALRYGRGTAADPERARTLLEAAVAADDGRALVELAEMLAEGEGGPADGKRAIALLTDPLARQASYAAWPVPAHAATALRAPLRPRCGAAPPTRRPSFSPVSAGAA
jgi:hypothetical protein